MSDDQKPKQPQAQYATEAEFLQTKVAALESQQKMERSLIAKLEEELKRLQAVLAGIADLATTEVEG